MARKRRHLISAAVLAACVGIALGVLAMLPPRTGVTKANFDRIEDGMTREEVDAIFGNPRILEDECGLRVSQWKSVDGTTIGICFRGDRILAKDFEPSAETIPDKLRRWLGLAK